MVVISWDCVKGVGKALVQHVWHRIWQEAGSQQEAYKTGRGNLVITTLPGEKMILGRACSRSPWFSLVHLPVSPTEKPVSAWCVSLAHTIVYVTLYVTLAFFYARLVMSRELGPGPRAPVHLSLYVGDWRSGVLIHPPVKFQVLTSPLSWPGQGSSFSH